MRQEIPHYVQIDDNSIAAKVPAGRKLVEALDTRLSKTHLKKNGWSALQSKKASLQVVAAVTTTCGVRLPNHHARLSLGCKRLSADVEPHPIDL
jgi:hypothetical protein